MFGYYRLASAVPQLRVAEVDYNVDQLTEGFRKAAEQQAAAVVFPELCITGYSCGDLFFQPNLRKAALNGLLRFTEATEGSGTIAVVGLPFLHEDALYNTAAVVQSGRILALVPKTVLPNYREFYEKRQFTSGRELGTGVKEVTINGVHIPFGEEIVFHEESSPFSFGVEICEDLWSVIPPSSKLALLGARAILNPSAGTELTGKAAYRRELVRQQSGRCLCAYVLSSAGVHESTTDTVFGGHSLIADNGRPAAEGERFCRESTLIFADVDFERLEAARLSESSFNDSKFFSLPGMPCIWPCRNRFPERPAWNTHSTRHGPFCLLRPAAGNGVRKSSPSKRQVWPKEWNIPARNGSSSASPAGWTPRWLCSSAPAPAVR